MLHKQLQVPLVDTGCLSKADIEGAKNLRANQTEMQNQWNLSIRLVEYSYALLASAFISLFI
jgi:hypothetical protein